MVYRLIEVKEFADYRAIADVFGYGTESVILGNAADVVLAIVLAERFIVPGDTLLYISTAQSRLLHNIVEHCPDTDKFFLCHAAIRWRSVAVLLFDS